VELSLRSLTKRLNSYNSIIERKEVKKIKKAEEELEKIKST